MEPVDETLDLNVEPVDEENRDALNPVDEENHDSMNHVAKQNHDSSNHVDQEIRDSQNLIDEENHDSPKDSDYLGDLDLCSICRGALVNENDVQRTLVTLKCVHKFHLGNLFEVFCTPNYYFVFFFNIIFICDHLCAFVYMSDIKYLPFQFVSRTMDP